MSTVVLRGLVLSILLSAAGQAQDRKPSYPGMAPIEQYLMDRNAEIALARSAAPEAISRDATILVLGRHGYETAIEGKNNFTCGVERSWSAGFDNPEFWNPKIRGPVCYNPAAVRSVLPVIVKRTELALAGLTKAQMADSIKAGFDKKDPPAVEPGAMSYMMSSAAYLTDAGDHNMAHLMFYTPHLEAAAWGADLHGSPVMFGGTDPVTVFFVAVGKWSDGTAAPPE